MQTRITDLHEGWSLRVPTPEKQLISVPATVPGHVHVDLVNAGLIGDPFYRCQEAGCQWVDRTDWTYRCVFCFTPDPDRPHRRLRFEGLDTYAEIFLNGERIGETDNMFLPLELDVDHALAAGANALEVRFHSAVELGERRRRDYFAQEGLAENTMNFDERAFVRKAQYMFGWDWGPRLVSCGIWRPVRLLEFSERITVLDVETTLLDGRGVMTLRAETSGEKGEVRFEITSPRGDRWAAVGPEAEIEVDDPDLWWPNGYGDAALYTVDAVLEIAGQALDTARKRVGFRTIRLRREPDSFGESFEFVVNGVPIWCRGANWIPDHSFPSLVTTERFREQLSRAVAMRMNMIRVWGGGIYELEEFYNAADELGLLVWQDFPFACSYAPDDLAFQSVVREEAEQQVRRLRHRACLALWCGNNENSTMWDGKWGGADRNPPRFYGAPLWEEVLPSVVARLDPERPYIPTSPVGVDGDANGGGVGDQHYWDAWHGRGDWIHYQDSRARFSSEFGFASSMSMEAWSGCQEPSDQGVDTTVVRWHDKTRKGYETYLGLIGLHYPAPEDQEDLVYYSQLNQRDAMRFAVELYRSEEFCKGTLIWQFNDCWPVQSWALMDHLSVWKAAAHDLARTYAHVLACVRREGDHVTITVANDGKDSYSGTLDLDWVNFRGQRTPLGIVSVAAPPHSRKVVWSGALQEDQRRDGALAIRLEGQHEYLRLLAEPKDLRFPAVNLSAEIRPNEVILRSEAPVFDLMLDSDQGQSAFQTNFVSFVGEIAVPLTNPVTWVRGRSLGNRVAL